MTAETLRPTAPSEELSGWPNPNVPRPVPAFKPQEAAEQVPRTISVSSPVDVHNQTYDNHFWYGVVTIWQQPEGYAKTEFRLSSIPEPDARWMAKVMGVPYGGAEHLRQMQEEIYNSSFEDYERRFPERQVLNISTFQLDQNFVIVPKKQPRSVSVEDPDHPGEVIQTPIKKADS